MDLQLLRKSRESYSEQSLDRTVIDHGEYRRGPHISLDATENRGEAKREYTAGSLCAFVPQHLVSCSSGKRHQRDSASGYRMAQLMPQEIEDTSGNCGASFAVVIVSPAFAKKMTLARHKLGELPFIRIQGTCS